MSVSVEVPAAPTPIVVGENALPIAGCCGVTQPVNVTVSRKTRWPLLFCEALKA